MQITVSETDSGPEIIVEDLNTPNGTLVNGVRVTRRILREDDFVCLGVGHNVDHEGLVRSLATSDSGLVRGICRE